MNAGIKELTSFLLSHDDYILFTHASADADTLGSAFALQYALKKCGKKAEVFNPEPMPDRLSFLLTDGASLVNVIPQGEHTLVSVDIASFAMLKGTNEEYLKELTFDYSIDHHDVNSVRTSCLLCLPHYPATGEIIAETVKEMGLDFDKPLAVWLYAAISSDSGCFKYSSTRPETYRVGADLVETGIDFAWINRRLFECKTEGQILLEKDAYEHLEFYYGGKVAVVCISDEILADCRVCDSDTDAVNQIPRQVKGVEVSAVIRRKGDEIKVSLRSNDYYDVAALAKSFGGGGHIHAAGCRFRTDIDDAKKQLLDALKDEFS